MTVIDEIAAERKRQVEAEGWSPEHDDSHWKGELAAAAACYVLAAQYIARGADHDAREFACGAKCPELWPFEKSGWKPRDQRRNLIRSAALIVAEIERLDRESKR